MSDEPIPMEGVRAYQIRVGDRIFEEGEVLTVKRVDFAHDGFIRIESECGWSFLGDSKTRLARVLPEPVEVREFWRVTRKHNGEMCFPTDCDEGMAKALTHIWLTLGVTEGKSIEKEHIRETVLSREVKP